jgi:hypothetical protein
MNSAKHLCAVLLLFGAVSPLWPQSATEEKLHQLLNQADHATRPQPWARLLIEADSEAVKLERREPCSCGDIRSVKAESFGFLHYRWNELQRSENYDHDLLRTVVRVLRGTPPGADAFVALLALGPYGGPWFDDDDFLPDEFAGPALHRRIISILESPSWLKLQDMRLTRIRAEAYDEWWSLSRADPQDPELSQNAVSASDYRRGSDLARQKQSNCTRASWPYTTTLLCAFASANCAGGRIRISVHGSAAAIDERGGDDNYAPKIPPRLPHGLRNRCGARFGSRFPVRTSIGRSLDAVQKSGRFLNC